MLRACLHHGFMELAQIDTFYKCLNDNDQDSLNAAAGGNLLSKTTREALQIIENKSKFLYSRNKLNVSRMNTTSRENASKSDDRIEKLTDQISTLVDIFAKKIVTPALVKAVEEYCVTCGGNHAYYNCPNTGSNQPSVCVTTAMLLKKFPKNLRDPGKFLIPCDFPGMDDKLFKLAKIPLNENCSAMLLKKFPKNLRDPGKFLIPCDFSGMDLSLPELTPTRMTLELADRSITHPKGVAKDVFIKRGKFHFLADFVVVDLEADPRVPLILAVTFNLNQTMRYSSTYVDLSVNRIDIIDVAREEYAQEILGFSSNSSGGSTTLNFKHILSNSSPSLTPFEGSDFILEEIDAYLKDDSISPKIDHANCDPEGDICLIEKLLNDDLFQLPPMDLKEVIKEKSSFEEPPEVELKDLPSHLKYAYLEENDKEGIVLGHKISKSGLEVDHAKVDVIAKLPHPTTVKSVRSFLGHAGFYRRFIQDFSKIARPMTHLLEKETPFVFSKDCIDAFETLKKKLTEAPILVTSRQVEVSNRGLKRVLERTVSENHASWSDKLDDALWAFRTAFKTPIGCTPYKLVYGKSCHLPIELKHKAYWALKHANFDLKTAGKLKTRWSGPFTFTKVFPYGTVEFSQPDDPNFKVNGHRVKYYFGGDVPQLVVMDLQTFPMDK
nr:reverse transcriptase domain-containing protein [Tanacetum cinerariifolium]